MGKQMISRLTEKLQSKKATRQLRRCCSCRNIALKQSVGMKHIRNIRWKALNADPWFSLEIAEPARWLFIKGEGISSVLYYASKKNAGFCHGKRIFLSKTDFKEGVWLEFPYEIKYLRVDPVDKAGDFILPPFLLKAQAEKPAPAEPVIKARAEYEEMSLADALKEYMEISDFEKNTAETILIFTHEMSRTGAPQLCLHIAQELKKQGKEILFVALRGGALDHSFLQTGKFTFFVKDMKEELKPVLQALAERGVSKALLNTVVCGAYAEMLADNGYQIISLIHEMRASILICNAIDSAQMLAKYAKAILFPSKCVERDFKSVVSSLQAQTYCFHQGMYRWATQALSKKEAKEELHRVLSVDKEVKIVLCAGVLNFGKGADILPQLLQSCRLLDPEKSKKLLFIWLGESDTPSYKIWLQMQIEKMSMQTQIVFPGYEEDGERYHLYMSGADAFLLSSREDSMPSVLFEAMACRTLCLAFEKSGGAEELLAQGRGCLVPFYDIEAMAHRLLACLFQNGETEQMAEDALRYIEKEGNMNQYVERLLKILEN